MKVSVLQFPKDVDRWNLVVGFMELRKRVFVDDMSWPLHTDKDLEYEQYDDPSTVYIVAHIGNEVLGGARLVRTDRQFGIYSYMIRDAHLQRVPGLPDDLCTEDPPVSPKTWELTRFMSADSLMVGEEILRTADDFLRSKGANQCLMLGPPAFMRMAKRMGYAPEPIGKVTGNRNGRFLAFACPLA